MDETCGRRGGSSLARRAIPAAALLAVSLVLGGASIARAAIFSEFPVGPRSVPPFGGLAIGITLGSDGALWFTESEAHKIGRISTTGSLTEFDLGVDRAPSEIAAGPDGALWFVDLSRIGRITVAGVITEFDGPPGAQILGIAAGPDGNLWFTFGKPSDVGGPAFGRIGRITTAGNVTEFDTLSGSLPIGITAGPDGNLWFAEAGVNNTGYIGRITPAGEVSEIALGSTIPFHIASGPDGNLWFTAQIFSVVSGGLAPSISQIGRIDPITLRTSTFTIPTAGSAPWGIAPGPDGNLWFTEHAPLASRVGRISPSGVITEFRVPTTGSGPTGITAGPQGDIWFTEAFAGKIGRITDLAATCSPSPTSLCLSDGRFRVEATWTSPDGGSGAGTAVALTPDSGYFWFFTPNDPEVMVRSIDGCAFNTKRWFFAAGLTNVEVSLRVTDFDSGETKPYSNAPETAFAPIQDTSAFLCRPATPRLPPNPS